MHCSNITVREGLVGKVQRNVIIVSINPTVTKPVNCFTQCGNNTKKEFNVNSNLRGVSCPGVDWLGWM